MGALIQGFETFRSIALKNEEIMKLKKTKVYRNYDYLPINRRKCPKYCSIILH